MPKLAREQHALASLRPDLMARPKFKDGLRLAMTFGLNRWCGERRCVRPTPRLVFSRLTRTRHVRLLVSCVCSPPNTFRALLRLVWNMLTNQSSPLTWFGTSENQLQLLLPITPNLRGQRSTRLWCDTKPWNRSSTPKLHATRPQYILTATSFGT